MVTKFQHIEEKQVFNLFRKESLLNEITPLFIQQIHKRIYLIYSPPPSLPKETLLEALLRQGSKRNIDERRYADVSKLEALSNRQQRERKEPSIEKI